MWNIIKAVFIGIIATVLFLLLMAIIPYLLVLVGTLVLIFGVYAILEENKRSKEP